MKKMFALLFLGAACSVFALDDAPLPQAFYDGDHHAHKSVDHLATTDVKLSAITQAVTNGQTGVVLGGMWNVIETGPGATNAIVLAAPGTERIGQLAILQVSTSATNVLAIADSGTANLTAAFAGGAGDVLFLLGVTTGQWYSIAGPANN